MEGTLYKFLYETRRWLDVIGLTLTFAKQSGNRTTVRWKAIDCYSFVVDACDPFSRDFGRSAKIEPQLDWHRTIPACRWLSPPYSIGGIFNSRPH